MKKVFLLCVFLLISITLAFPAGVLTYEILRPASDPLPKDVKTLAFVYRNYNFKADSITHFYKYNDETFVDNEDYTKLIAESAYWGFRATVEEHYSLDTIPFVMLDETEGDSLRTIPPLTWDKVNLICAENKSDVLVSLDDITIFNNYETWFDGEKYNGVADISSFHRWTVYDPLTEVYLFEEAELDSLQAFETDYYLEQLVKSRLPHREEIMKVVAFSIGEALGKKLAPYWETVYREYYDSGTREMREAAKKVREEKWDEALQIWAEIQTNAPDKHKARAAFNMAIVHERLGLLTQALIDIQVSINFYKNIKKLEKERELAETLKEVLQRRKSEVEQLKAQNVE
ncbi:hypothetical protein C7377_0797 [Balneicella halophila]|uniref:Tetratricopeptide repeat protein n=1 Tax=Balneicella halophila TaxID=1537566 RepID=A0A7L4US41_BALHA|nr:DUF6340 family protein [Balneicella halophila]PVX52479.1 hypothetical protein C7377_0797 [Balneicella halophila]